VVEQKCYVCLHVFTESDLSSTSVAMRAIRSWLAAEMTTGRARTTGRSFGHLLEQDVSLRVIAEIGDGQQASRTTIGGAWTRGPLTD
jgi:hypothetical protein